ncbi:hypothetical protein VNO77_18883 [Canavalia gladiata]|uniref:Uncharacterized protein n=1 Tax=Canavalia gladiata TaxID=3824 RepID=A0AAN9LLM0_CANGL
MLVSRRKWNPPSAFNIGCSSTLWSLMVGEASEWLSVTHKNRKQGWLPKPGRERESLNRSDTGSRRATALSRVHSSLPLLIAGQGTSPPLHQVQYSLDKLAGNRFLHHPDQANTRIEKGPEAEERVMLTGKEPDSAREERVEQGWSESFLSLKGLVHQLKPRSEPHRSSSEPYFESGPQELKLKGPIRRVDHRPSHCSEKKKREETSYLDGRCPHKE